MLPFFSSIVQKQIKKFVVPIINGSRGANVSLNQGLRIEFVRNILPLNAVAMNVMFSLQEVHNNDDYVFVYTAIMSYNLFKNILCISHNNILFMFL